MLQQTQVDRVIPYYERFLETLPTVAALADAPASVVITMWSGLGYNRRAVNLQRTAQAVMERFGGVFPRDPDELLLLPGIGPYTSGAIACFAFEQPVAFLDTNMKRVVHRLVSGPDVPNQSISDKQLTERPTVGAPGRCLALESGPDRVRRSAMHRPQTRLRHLPTPIAMRRIPGIQSVIAALPVGTRKKAEAPFEGSNRYYRGRLVETLRTQQGDGIAFSVLGQQIRADYAPEHAEWLQKLVRDLERDGLAKVAEPKARLFHR